MKARLKEMEDEAAKLRAMQVCVRGRRLRERERAAGADAVPPRACAELARPRWRRR